MVNAASRFEWNKTAVLMRNMDHLEVVRCYYLGSFLSLMNSANTQLGILQSWEHMATSCFVSGPRIRRCTSQPSIQVDNRATIFVSDPEIEYLIYSFIYMLCLISFITDISFISLYLLMKI